MNFFAPTLYRATIFNPIAPNEGEYFPDGGLAVERDGSISFCGRYQEAHVRYADAVTVDLRPHIITPGLVDTHAHLPQYDAIGLGSGEELLTWLERRIFPVEELFMSEEFAYAAAVRFFRKALSCGTTSMAVYSAPFYSATRLAFKAAAETGIKVWMGKTMMDTNAPAALLKPAMANIRLSESLMKEWHEKDSGRLNYIVTPRFAGSCSPTLLRNAADFASQNGLLVQTHLSENKKELAFIASLFPNEIDYTGVYESYGLLGRNTIAAHCIYLSPRELRAILDTSCGVAHCPTSNRYLRSGIMPLNKYLQSGMRVGLGSDVAGGYSLSVMNEAREAMEQSKTYSMYTSESDDIIHAGEALYLATLGGADILHSVGTTGNFIAGKDADFVVHDGAEIFNATTTVEQPENVLARLFYTQPTVLATYIRGKKVYELDTLNGDVRPLP